MSCLEIFLIMGNSYQLIISRLRHDVLQDRTFYDKNIAVMIADAKKVRKDRQNIRMIDRVMYEYTITLEERSGEMLNSLNEYSINRNTYRKLLAFFESL